MNENQAQDKSCGQVGYGYGSQIRGESVMQTQKQDQNCAAERQTAKGALRVRAKQLHREAERLEALARALPEELPPMADEALYDLIRAAR